MKIVIVVEKFPPKWLAGTEIATYNIAEYLSIIGHEVHVITSFDKGLPEKRIEKGFYVHRAVHSNIKFMGVIYFWLEIFRILRHIDPDIVHIQSIAIGMPGILAKLFLDIPYIVWAQGSDVYLHWRLKTLISKLVLKNANAIIALTENMRKEIKKTHMVDVSVIPNGIELEEFKELSKEDARAKLDIKENSKIILFVGTLRPIKGTQYLIQAMNMIKKERINARLTIIGDGEERPNLEKLTRNLNLEDFVMFAGKVPHEKVLEYMIASDIFALPSLSEGFPLVCLEAMACGLPIVATNVRGLPEIIKRDKNGFTVEPSNPIQIAEKILLLIKDDGLRKRMSQVNKKSVENYRWSQIVKKLEMIYQNCL